MCGIAGWYARGGRPVAEATVRAMCDSIVHRGPDDEGLFTEGDFGFGMRRLAIVDVAGGHQPIVSDDGRHVITFNGEIFNHPELRAELEALGHRYRTNSDTETILRGFQQWGDGVWARLEGMFAVAIRDRVTRTEVRSPVRGTIKDMKVSTVGGVIRPGQDILEIVPLEDTLLVEAQLRPADIAFVRPGQPAIVKVTAYDFSIFGGLEAELEQISADTIQDERGERWFRVRLRTQKAHLGTE